MQRRARTAVGTGGLRKSAPSLAALAVALFVSACSVADHFAVHSIEYNLQAEINKNQNLLLNIIRAAWRRPMQFTDLTTITGQVSVQGSLGLAAPLFGPSNGDSRIGIGSTSVSTTDSPSFTVAVLNTKEFYQGILTPIPVQAVAYYLRIGFPRMPLLTLLLSEIEYGPSQARTHVENRLGHEKFAELLRAMIRLGLNVEQYPHTIVLSPPLAPQQYPSAKDIGELEAKGIRVVQHSGRDAGRLRQAGSFYQLEKTATAYRFCFDPAYADDRAAVRPGGPIGNSGLRLEPGDLCGADMHDKTSEDAKPRALVFHTRSTEGIIYYLGQIARQQLGLVPTTAGLPGPELFLLQKGQGGPGTISVAYEGANYHIAVDPAGADRSAQVLELVTQLLALNNSAKDLPAPSVIPIAR